MVAHDEDVSLISYIQNTITDQMSAHPSQTHILCGEFNGDIALIGRQNNQQTTTPQVEDYQWRIFIDNVELTYIPTNTTFSRQRGHNYTINSLIGGFYIKSPNNSQ